MSVSDFYLIGSESYLIFEATIQNYSAAKSKSFVYLTCYLFVWLSSCTKVLPFIFAITIQRLHTQFCKSVQFIGLRNTILVEIKAIRAEILIQYSLRWWCHVCLNRVRADHHMDNPACCCDKIRHCDRRGYLKMFIPKQ